MNTGWVETKVLIFGKTYPELSSKYYETVCTAGVLENGKFIRLYPIPFRYLENDKLFSKYQWLSMRIKKSSDDPRPESFKVDPNSIKIIGTIPSDKKGWLGRSDVIFKSSNHTYESAEKLIRSHVLHKTSLGFVKPKRIDEIEVVERPKEDYDDFVRKLQANQIRTQQTQMFEFPTISDVKKLEYVSKRFKIHWCCNDPRCTGHKMSILDWEAYELVRKVGITKAQAKIESILRLSTHDVGFFLGNFRIHPNRFDIGSIWYPKRNQFTETPRLF